MAAAKEREITSGMDIKDLASLSIDTSCCTSSLDTEPLQRLGQAHNLLELDDGALPHRHIDAIVSGPRQHGAEQCQGESLERRCPPEARNTRRGTFFVCASVSL